MSADNAEFSSLPLSSSQGEVVSEHSVGAEESLAEEVVKSLADNRVSEAVFNSYVYNQVEEVEFKKKPLVEKCDFSKANDSEPESKEEEKVGQISLESTLCYQYLIKIAHTHLAENLFVLGTFLGGKRKRELQAKLFSNDFVAELKELFAKIRWNKLPVDVPSRNRSDTALKMQLLRFIYNLTSRDEWSLGDKLRFVSREEIETLLWCFGE